MLSGQYTIGDCFMKLGINPNHEVKLLSAAAAAAAIEVRKKRTSLVPCSFPTTLKNTEKKPKNWWSIISTNSPPPESNPCLGTFKSKLYET
jgi:hypothetical protein